MLKKLQNILFEDEEIIEEQDIIEEKPKEVPKKKEPTVVASVEPEAPVEEKPAMSTRIDVTQPIDKQEVLTESNTEPVFKPVEPVQHAEPNVEVEAEKKKSIGLTVDDLSDTAKPKKVEQAPTTPKGRKQPYVYEFQPVISPIFGVDEKDLDAVQTTAKGTRPGSRGDESVSTVISPMYGVAQSKVDMKTNVNVEPMVSSKTVEEIEEYEDDVPEFSLDDILKVRDDEFSESVGEQTSLFGDEPNEDDVDQTRVFNASDLD